VQDNYKQPAHLNYAGVQRKNPMMYTIYYTADTDILGIYNLAKGEETTHKSFECAINTASASDEGPYRQTLVGMIERDDTYQDKLHFKTDALYYETHDNGTSESLIENAKLVPLLKKTSALGCTVKIKALYFKPYKTNTMFIPTDDLLREIQRP